jgi:hypothetical protein
MNSLPNWIEQRLETAPHYSDRRGLAQLLTSLFGPISYRTIEGRPLTWQMSNGRAVTETRHRGAQVPRRAGEENRFVKFRSFGPWTHGESRAG